MAADPSVPSWLQGLAAAGVFVGGAVMTLKSYVKPPAASVAGPAISPDQLKQIVDATTSLPRTLVEIRDAVDRVVEANDRCEKSVDRVREEVRDLHDAIKRP